MYGTRGSAPMGISQCSEPDWNQAFIDRTEELRIVVNLKVAILEFIEVVKPSMYDNNPLATLLGTIEIDVLQRRAELAKISKKLDSA